MATQDEPVSLINSFQCSGDLLRNSCVLTEQLNGEKDALATVRIILSSLSILGSISIIITTIARRQVWSPKIHPIFQLFIADCLLSFLWIIGGGLWLRDDHDRVGCLVVAMFTVILECVTINLKLVYALSVHTFVMKKNSGSIFHFIHSTTEQVWHPIKSCIIYVTAWTFPAMILMITFGVLAANTTIVSGVSECSCWCLPGLGNVLPFAIPRDQPTAVYVWDISKLVVSFGSLLFLNYLVVFSLLVFLHVRIMRHIGILTQGYYANLDINKALQQGQSTMKKIIVYFLSTFVVIGFINLLFSLVAIIYEGLRIHLGPVISASYQLHTGVGSQHAYDFHSALHFMQSISICLQGFINAMIYAWTREDHLTSVSAMSSRNEGAELEVSVEEQEDVESEELGELSRELETPDDHEHSVVNDKGTSRSN